MPGTEPPVTEHLRRLSTSSSEASSQDITSNQLSQENLEYNPTRLPKVPAPRPASNPLQFIKVGPCDLYKSAQEQLKKVEAVKKLKQEVREEQEDWQSNLDNWKSSRRKRQEHIIERVVEVKRFEDESVERSQPRRRNKTFSEMMEERRGGASHVRVVYSQDDDGNDLSDLGLGSDSSTPSTPNPPIIFNSYEESYQESSTIKQNENSNEENENLCKDGTNGNSNGHSGNNGHSTPITSPEPDEEYTYERAIQSYVNFAENQVKKLATSNSMKQQPPIPPAKPKRDSFINELNGNSEADLNKKNSSLVSLVPKGDILKRREIFEKAAEMGSMSSIGESGNEIEENTGYRQERRLSELTNTKSIKERLWNLTDNSKLGVVTSPTSPSTTAKVEVTASVKDRLSNLQRHAHSTENSTNNLSPKLDITQSVRERLNNLERNAHQEPGRQVTPDRDPAFLAKLANFMKDEERASSPEEAIYATKRTQLHRSMDSLGSSPLPADTPGSAFERVQSLEDLLDCRSSLPSSDREDSGIHTADVSCAVSQADEESGGDPLDLATDLGPHKRQGSELSEQLSPLPPIEETPIEPTDTRAPSDPDCNISPMKTPELESGRNTPIETDESATKPNNSAALLALDALIAPTYSSEKQVEDFMIIPMVEETTDIVNNNQDVLQLLQNEHQAPVQKSTPFEISKEKDGTEKIDILLETIESTKAPALDKEIILDLSNASIELPSLTLECDLAELEFPLRGLSCAEPPKEKPPPPPPLEQEENVNQDTVDQLINSYGNSKEAHAFDQTRLALEYLRRFLIQRDDSQQALATLGTLTTLPMKISLRRLDSTKRIQKELRRKRSDFLGIADDHTDDLFLEPVLQVAPPPDMTEFLAEERRTEQQLYRQSICSSELDDSIPAEECQDSGVELERPTSAQHSAQNSEIYGNDASITSEEEELIKKEREIIERLEKEEEWRNKKEIDTKEEITIGNSEDSLQQTVLEQEITADNFIPSEQQKEDIKENLQNKNDSLAEKLRMALEEQKRALEWARAEEERRRNMEELQRIEDEQRLRAKEIQLQQQENNASDKNSSSRKEQMKELREERERLQQEQEELQRQKEEIRLQEELQRQKEEMRILEERHQRQQQEAAAVRTSCMEEEAAPPLPPAPANYRLSLPDLQDEQNTNNNNGGMLMSSRHRPPPPIPPARPLRSIANEHPIRNSRMPSADSIPHQVEAQQLQLGSVPAHLNQQPPPSPQHQHSPQSQQMTRQTLQALSAAPRLRIADSWVQPKRKPADQVHRHSTGTNYNYHHWLIQEAEHRRIHEQHQRQWPPTPQQPPTPPQPQQQQQQQQQLLQQQLTKRTEKPLPDSIIHTLTQRVQNRAGINDSKRRTESSPIRETPPPLSSSASSTTSSSPSTNNSYPHHRQQTPTSPIQQPISNSPNNSLINHNGNDSQQEKMLSVSGKKKCSHCNEELGRGAAMIIESLRLFYHIDCFKCCVCHVQLGDGLMGTDVRVRNNKLHCHNCYSSDDGIKFSCV